MRLPRLIFCHGNIILLLRMLLPTTLPHCLTIPRTSYISLSYGHTGVRKGGPHPLPAAA